MPYYYHLFQLRKDKMDFLTAELGDLTLERCMQCYKKRSPDNKNYCRRCTYQKCDDCHDRTIRSCISCLDFVCSGCVVEGLWCSKFCYNGDGYI